MIYEFKMTVALLLLNVGMGHAEGNDVPHASVHYGLDECVRIGLSQSGAARNALHDQNIASERIRQAYGLALPHLSVNAGYTRLDELQEIDFGGDSQTFGILDNYDLNARVEQLLYSGGRVGAALRAAKTTRAYADAAREATDAELIHEIETRFAGILLSREAVMVQASSIEQLAAYVEQTQQKSDEGAASEFDLLTAKVRFANETPKLLAARNSHALAVAEFSALLNLPVAGVFTGRLECAEVTLSYDEMERLALANRAVLRSSALRLDLGREQIINARSKSRPELRAHFNYNGANAYQFVSFEEGWEWHWNAGVVLSWDLWDGGLTRHTVKEEQVAYEKLLTQDEELFKQVKLDVKRAFLGLQHAREAMASSEDNVALAERALEIAKTRHETGLATYLEFTDSNLALSTARLTRFQALHDYAVAASAMRYACGLHKNVESEHRGDE